MNIIFGLELDGSETINPVGALDCIRCGPLGLLQVLETRLGLRAKLPTHASRIAKCRELLETLAGTRDVFYRESFRKDEHAVAETLLQWRDDLLEAGWDGGAGPEDSQRLQDLAALEVADGAGLPPGPADRLRRLAATLESRSARIDSITVLDERDHLPVLWQRVCDRLDARYAPVDAALRDAAAPGATDLGKFQAQLLAGEKAAAGRMALANDRSIFCLTAGSEITLARGVAQWLRRGRQDSVATLLIAGSGGAVVDRALRLEGEPVTGLLSSSRARPVPQVLLMALRLYWKPLDPRALLEFLTHPACPLSGSLRWQLARAVAESPGVGGSSWEKALATARDRARQKHGGDPEMLSGTLARMDRDLEEWILVSQFEPDAGAAGAVLSECCARVVRWASGRAGVPDVTPGEREQFMALSAYGSEMVKMLAPLSRVTRSQLERMLHQAGARGWQDTVNVSELGHVASVRDAAAVTEPADIVVWWDFAEPPPRRRLPWTARELGQLAVRGVRFLSPETLAARDRAISLRPLLAARRQLVLARPRQRAGEPVAGHPLEARLESLLPDRSPLPLIDLDREVAGAGSGPFVSIELARRPLPRPRRWWRVSRPERIGPREEESYSSAEKFIYSPHAWVLRHKARLEAGALSSLRMRDDHRQIGTLLHRVLDLLLLAPDGEIQWLTATHDELRRWMERHWPKFLEEEGANLLLPGRRADAAALLETTQRALWSLLEQLRSAGVRTARSNLRLEAVPFAGGRMVGILDLLVERGDGGRAVVDLKFGGGSTRETELRENRALQLAVYGRLLCHSSGGAWPAAAFYIIKDGHLLAPGREYFPDARVVDPSAAGSTLEHCWSDFERVWRWRREQLNEGWIEVTVAGVAAGDGTDTHPDSIPPVAHWIASKDHGKFNDFDALTGWEVDA